MLSSKEVKDLLNGSMSYRGDCPMCGGSNSFSANQTLQGSIAWICFKASCKERGNASLTRSVAQIVGQLIGRVNSPLLYTFELPDYFTTIGSREKALLYLHNNNLEHAYANKKVDLKYDPKQDRVVFLIYDDKVLVDAIGRKLSSGKPKWYRYGSSEKGCWFTNKNSDTLVITEDIPSACVASYNFNSLALLGTELSQVDTHTIIKDWDNVIVALDPDAYSKGVSMSTRLSPYTNVKAVLLPDDLKYYTPKKAKDILNGG